MIKSFKHKGLAQFFSTGSHAKVQAKHAERQGHVRITADMAIRLAAALDTEAQLWLNLQAQHDLWVASQRPPKNIKSLRQVAA